MSAYKDFVSDFPQRCGDVLSAFTNAAAARDRDVTLMLMVASAGFVAPYERLKPDGRFPHAFQDRARFAKHSKQLDQLLSASVLDSGLWTRHMDEWHHGELAQADTLPDTWPELNAPTPMSAALPTLEPIDLLRNALAHASVQITADPSGAINKILFVSDNTKASSARTGFKQDYRYLQTSPRGLYSFLTEWFAKLLEWNVEQIQVVEQLAAANAA